MVFAALAKGALKSAAKSAASQAKGMAKNLAKEATAELKGAAMAAKNQAVAAGRAKANQMTKNAIKFGTAKLNQAQSRVANKMGAMAVGVQGGAPVMVGPKGGNFRMNARGQRLPMLPVR
jgi:CMP-2-keto-3-deoxyoctulosonic acid synthetase